jgi:hypothetical protein
VSVDSGISTQFKAESLADELALTLTVKKVGDRVRLANEDVIFSRPQTHTLYSKGPFNEKETFHLLPLASFDLGLGRPRLYRHNPDEASSRDRPNTAYG